MKQGQIIAILFFFCCEMAAFSADIGTTINVIGFDSTLNKTFTGIEADSLSFMPVGNIWTGFDVSDTMDLTITVEHDPILRTRIIPVVGFSYNLVNLKIGPFIGLSDIREVDINPGISMTLDIAAPGIVFGSIRFDTTVSGGIVPKNFAQELWEVKAGFWTPYVIFSLSAQNRSFTERKEAEIYTNEWTRYTLSLNFFQKNIPRIWQFNLGFQQLEWLPHSRPEEKLGYNSFFLGAEFHVVINRTIEFFIGGEGSVYSWEAKNTIDSGMVKSTLFEVFSGVTWSINQ
jgi:hypothetical protein